jgi:hypothetical protein
MCDLCQSSTLSSLNRGSSAKSSLYLTLVFTLASIGHVRSLLGIPPETQTMRLAGATGAASIICLRLSRGNRRSQWGSSVPPIFQTHPSHKHVDVVMTAALAQSQYLVFKMERHDDFDEEPGRRTLAYGLVTHTRL